MFWIRTQTRRLLTWFWIKSEFVNNISVNLQSLVITYLINFEIYLMEFCNGGNILNNLKYIENRVLREHGWFLWRSDVVHACAFFWRGLASLHVNLCLMIIIYAPSDQWDWKKRTIGTWSLFKKKKKKRKGKTQRSVTYRWTKHNLQMTADQTPSAYNKSNLNLNTHI